MGGIVTELKMASDKLESDRVDKAKQVMDLHREVAQNVRRDRQAGQGGQTDENGDGCDGNRLSGWRSTEELLRGRIDNK